MINTQGQIVDADEGEDTDQQMNENADNDNDISIEEAPAPDTGDSMLMGINSLAIVTPLR